MISQLYIYLKPFLALPADIGEPTNPAFRFADPWNDSRRFLTDLFNQTRKYRRAYPLAERYI